MNFLNIFEDHVAGIFGATRAPFSFKKLAKQAAREMEDQTLVVNGVNTAPALYTILVASADDQLLAPYYPQLASEVSEFVKAQAEKKRYVFVGEPLVRFMTDPALKGGKFSVFAENVDAPTLGRLYEEERAYQAGLSQQNVGVGQQQFNVAPAQQQRPAVQEEPVQQAALQSDIELSPLASVSEAATDNDEGFDPFESVSSVDLPEAFPVPQTISREAMAGMGGAAVAGAAGAAGAAATSVAANMVNARAPQAAATPSAKLIDVVTGDVYEVNSARCTIGRERANSDVALRDPNVSRRHAQLTFNGSDWTIEDLNSTNGTLVNNRRVTRCPLRDGDLLTFGLSTFEFRA